MHKLALKEAELKLADLINEVANGEEVIIIREDGKAFEIIPATALTHKRRLIGVAKGQIWMSDDFDEPLEDFEAYSC